MYEEKSSNAILSRQAKRAVKSVESTCFGGRNGDNDSILNFIFYTSLSF